MKKILLSLIFVLVITLGVFSFQIFGLKQILAQSSFVSGFISLWDGTEVVELNMVPVNDAISAGHGVVKIETSDGVAAADLGLITHNRASGVRVRTTYGTRSWLMAPSLWARDIDTDNTPGWSGDYGKAVVEAPDGSISVISQTRKYNGDNSVSFYRFDNEGVYQWMRNIYWGEPDTWGYDLIRTFDNGYIMAGGERPFSGYNNALIVKLNSAGSLLWSNYISFAPYDSEDTAFSVVETSDNGLLIAGETTNGNDGCSPSICYPKGFITKLSSTGVHQWSYKFTISGSSYFRAQHAIQTSDGGYLIAGEKLIFPGPSYYPSIIKLDSARNVEWSRVGATAGSVGGVFEKSGGGGYVLHAISSGHSVILNLDSNGNYITRYCTQTLYSSTQTPDGGYLLTGQISSRLGMLKLDSNFNGEWSESAFAFGYRGDDAIQTNDGGYVTTGWRGSGGYTAYRGFLVKYSSGGSSCSGTSVTPWFNNSCASTVWNNQTVNMTSETPTVNNAAVSVTSFGFSPSTPSLCP